MAKNLFKNLKDIDKDYKAALNSLEMNMNEYTRQDYVDDTYSNADPTTKDERLLKVWLKKKKKGGKK